MKQCDTCAGPLADGHPFALCPKCLFGAAIHARDEGEISVNGNSPLVPRPNFFEKYDILEKVASGGQGEVWKVWDFEFCRCVAMKRLAESAVSVPAAVHRFLAEAQIASQLEHPGILPIFDVGLDPDARPFYTTQLLSGETLADVWRHVHSPGRTEWSLNRAVELLLRVCEVMGHAHSRGVIHRDLKPANVLVGSFGDVRVVDWGSAHLLESSRQGLEEAFGGLGFFGIETDRRRALQDDPASVLATASSGQPVTLLFTPPEIIAGDASALGPATDIYAVGVMLYQLLTGRSPYCLPDGELPDRDRLKQAKMQGPPAPVRSLNWRASRDLTAICEKAMAHERAGRYATMADLADDLRAALEIRPVQARQPGVFLRLQKWSQRNFSYVLLAGVALLFLAVAFSSAHGFKAQRDAARQSALVRNAELAARSGRWHDALNNWKAADAAGYRDKVYLGLQEAQAWTVLAEPERADALLTRLMARSDLGDQRGVVLLRLGEEQLFDAAKAAHGVKLVREAMAAGLTNADLFFARGLLADSTADALDLFHQALRYDPYHHGAHRYSLSLEFLLGRHDLLANHLDVFKILYPDDSSSAYITATEAAMAGDNQTAEGELAALRNQMDTNAWQQAREACRAYAAAAKYYDVDNLLREQPAQRTPLDKLRADPLSAGVMLMSGDFTALTNQLKFRIPRLPCLQQGMLAAGDGVRRLLLPYLGNQALAAEEIELGWRHHPESLMPTLAGMLLENEQPKTGPQSSAIAEMQARLYQEGADSSSMFPQIRRLARYLAARTDFELATQMQTNSVTAISNCLANIRHALVSPQTSPLECRAYFQFALALKDNDLAQQIVGRLEKSHEDDETTRRSRIQVELAQGALGPALEKLSQFLVDHPGDAWAVTERHLALSRLKTLTASTGITPQ